jgi:hypothetical protein
MGSAIGAWVAIEATEWTIVLALLTGYIHGLKLSTPDLAVAFFSLVASLDVLVMAHKYDDTAGGKVYITTVPSRLFYALMKVDAGFSLPPPATPHTRLQSAVFNGIVMLVIAISWLPVLAILV